MRYTIKYACECGNAPELFGNVPNGQKFIPEPPRLVCTECLRALRVMKVESVEPSVIQVPKMAPPPGVLQG